MSKVVLVYVIILLAPELLYNVYESVYIDVVLGILVGVGFSKCYLERKKNYIDIIYILGTASMLILMKDSGMLFSAAVVITFLLDYIQNEKNKIVVIWALLSIIIPKFLWEYEIEISGVKGVFDYNFNMKIFLQAIIGIDGSYRSEVVKNYIQQFFNGYTYIGNHIEISPLFMFLSEFLILFYIAIYNKKKNKGNISVIYCFEILTIIYIVGICSAYMFNFSSYEALILASYERYINVIFVAGWIFCILLIIDILKNKKSYCLLFLCISLVVITPLNDIKLLVTRKYSQDSQEAMKSYQTWSNIIKDGVEEGSRIYTIFQEDNGYGRLALKYFAKPNIVNPAGVAWSLGPPFYDGDIWSEEKSVDEWQEELVNNYDYVLLVKLNDYFKEYYGSIFDNSTSLENSSLFKVNKKTGLLEACN